MAKNRDVEELEARHGQRMIEVKVRFWTNNIAANPQRIMRKHAWASGVVRITSNAAHGIVPGRPIQFHSMFDITNAIEKALIAHEIQLHIPRKMKKYVSG